MFTYFKRNRTTLWNDINNNKVKIPTSKCLDATTGPNTQKRTRVSFLLHNWRSLFHLTIAIELRLTIYKIWIINREWTLDDMWRYKAYNRYNITIFQIYFMWKTLVFLRPYIVSCSVWILFFSSFGCVCHIV